MDDPNKQQCPRNTSKVMKMGSSVQTELKLGDMKIEETDKYLVHLVHRQIQVPR